MSRLKPIIESRNGIHLTAYLENRGRSLNLRKQLRELISEARDLIRPALPEKELEEFMRPITHLMWDSKLLESIQGHIGIFRNSRGLRLIRIPVEVTTSVHVAETFHVKPILRWIQVDQEFLLIGFGDHKVFLYSGCHDRLKLMGSIATPEISPHTLDYDNVDSWLKEFQLNSKSIVYIAGRGKPYFGPNLRNRAIVQICNFFRQEDLNLIRSLILEDIQARSKRLIDRSLSEYRLAEDQQQTRNNLSQVTKAVVQGKVKKLIISNDIMIHGRIDRCTGDLLIHPHALDHEDDDILDDLAQMVLKQGGEVVVASREHIPKGLPVLAILSPGTRRTKRKPKDVAAIVDLKKEEAL